MNPYNELTSLAKTGEAMSVNLDTTGPLMGDEKLVVFIVKKELGLEVLESEPIVGRGQSNTVFIAPTSGGKFVVRLNNVSHLKNFEKEAWCLERCHELGVPVPRVIKLGVASNKSFSIAQFVESSTPIHDGMNKIQLWETLGEYAAKLNRIDIRSSRDLKSLQEWFGNLEGFIAREIAIIFRDNYWEKCGLFSPEDIRLIHNKLEKLSSAEMPISICHWDIGLDNCLVAEDKLYMLDLEYALVAPSPIYQLAVVGRTYGFHSMEMQAFSKGYGVSPTALDEMSEDLNCVVALLRMRSLRWAQDRSPGQIVEKLRYAGKAICAVIRG